MMFFLLAGGVGVRGLRGGEAELGCSASGALSWVPPCSEL